MGASGQRRDGCPVIWLPLSLLLFASYHLLRAWRLRPWRAVTPAPPTQEGPLVSFLVPAWSASEDIPAFVEAYRALSIPHKELLLCVGDHGSLELAERYAGGDLKVLEQHPEEGKQGALAKCFAASTGAVIYLTDIDCRLDDLSVARVLSPIVSGREAVVTGISKPLPTQCARAEVVVQWAVERKTAGPAPRYVDGVLGRNCALTREAAEAIGGFRYAAPTGTDYRMAQRLRGAGYHILLEPSSEVATEFPWPLSVHMRKQGRWLRNVVLYAERPRQRAEFRGVLLAIAIPYALLALVVLSLLLAHPLPLLLVLLVFAHGVLNRLHYAREVLVPPYAPRKLLWGSVINLVATLGAGLQASLTLLTPALRRQW